MHQLLQI
nr:unnamed protein product [Callosobruchus chinensis]